MPKKKNEPKSSSSDAASTGAGTPVGYATDLGTMYLSTVEAFLASAEAEAHRGKVNLIFTSPPFILNRKKKYAHTDEEEYVRWLSELAPKLKEMLTPDGSIVMELGNAWKPGEPVMTTAVMEAFLGFLKVGQLELCQQFVWDNPARLPSPAQWVTVTRMRVKDSFTHVWWMAPSTRPKADNRRVLKPYSKSMEKLLERQSYNAGRRPSGHGVSKTGFLTRHDGAIASNFLDFPDDVDPETYEQYIPANTIRMSNTSGAERYRKYCADNGFTPHPAPMPMKLVEFFVKFLTEEGDTVYDPFGGSNTTGAVAEALRRRWLATEPSQDFVNGSRGRFEKWNPTPDS